MTLTIPTRRAPCNGPWGQTNVGSLILRGLGLGLLRSPRGGRDENRSLPSNVVRSREGPPLRCTSDDYRFKDGNKYRETPLRTPKGRRFVKFLLFLCDLGLVSLGPPTSVTRYRPRVETPAAGGLDTGPSVRPEGAGPLLPPRLPLFFCFGLGCVRGRPDTAVVVPPGLQTMPAVRYETY